MNNDSIDAGKALTFMFDDPDWVKKFLIGVLMVLFSWLVLPAFFLQGYVIGIARRVSQGQTTVLPDWENWGKFFSDGAAYIAATLVYAIPIILSSCCLVFVLSASTDASGEISGPGALILCCFMIAAVLYALFMGLLLYAGVVNYIKKGNISAFFEFGKLWQNLQAHAGKYGIVILVVFAASAVASFIPLLGTVWSQFLTGHLIGQLARTTGGPAPVPAGFGEGPLDDLDLG